MTDKSHAHDGAGETDDLSALPYLNEAERAEQEWLMARETAPSAAPPSSKTAAEYEHLEGMLSTLPEPALSEHWNEALMARARASRSGGASRPRRMVTRWAAATTSLAAAAGVVIALRGGGAEVASLADAKGLYYTLAASGPVRGGAITKPAPNVVLAAPGALLTSVPIVSDRDAACLYSKETMQVVAKCPGGPSCRKGGQGLSLEIKLDVPGHYVFIGIKDAPRPLDGVLDDMEAFERAAGPNVERVDITVE